MYIHFNVFIVKMKLLKLLKLSIIIFTFATNFKKTLLMKIGNFYF